MSNLIEDAIQILQRIQREAADDLILKQIVGDHLGRPMHQPLVGPGTKVRVSGAPEVRTVGDGKGFSNSTPSIEAWRAPDQRYADALFDAEDAKWRAERAAELARVKGGGAK
jgi:hypothetical protein